MSELDDDKRIDASKVPSTLGSVDNFIGTVIDDRYKIKSRIARGGMATVYRAQDRRLDRVVAIKIMHPHLAESPDFIARFRREARAAASLTHPGVVAIHDQGIVNGSGYLVMELIEGPNLRTLIKREGCFTLGKSLNIILEILQALNAAHNAGIVHRDMKPENVLMTPYHQVKVADFGLARAVSETTAATTSSILGTVSYMAPEIITSGSADCKTDIYATGIMLYELITGHTPLSGSTPIQIAYKHVHEPMPSICSELNWVPVEVENIINMFTDRDMNSRPDASASINMIKELLRALPADVLNKKADVEPQLPLDDNDKETEYDSGATSALSYSSGTMALNMNESAYKPVGLKNRFKESLKHNKNLVDSNDSSDSLEHEKNIISDGNTENVDNEQSVKLLSDRSSDEHIENNDINNHDISTPVEGISVPEISNVVTEDACKNTEKETKTCNTKTLIKSKKLWISILSIIVIACFASWWFILGPGSYKNVPVVTNFTVERAVKILNNDDIIFDKKFVYSDTIPKDKVVGTDPKGKVYRNRRVKLLISKGVQQINIPNISNLTPEEARKVLLKANLKVNKDISQVWSDDVEKGKVASTDPAAGTVIPHTKFVTIQVSKGREPINVPNIVGKPLDQAQKTLADSGLKAEFSEDFSDGVPKGAVVSQSPGPNTTLYRNDIVRFVVSKGPRTIPVPDVFGKSVGEATNILQGAGFKVSINKVFGGVFGIVRSTTPGAGSQLQPGSTITVTVL